MAITLVPLCELTVQLRPPIVIPAGPAGTRMIFEVDSIEMRGRISGHMLGVATADWFVAGPDGTGSLDVRATMETDDGAVVFAHYYGRSDARDLEAPEITIYVAPVFETADPRYQWLNRILAVGKGVVDMATLRLAYTWAEVR